MGLLDLQTQQKAIGNAVYVVTPLPAGAALKMAARIARIIAPVISEVSSMTEVKGALGSALVDLIEALDDATVEYLYTTLAPSTRVMIGGASLDLGAVFDEHFRGRVLECMEWLKFSLEVNFAPLVESLLKEASAEEATNAK
jgi:hypothetical protein